MRGVTKVYKWKHLGYAIETRFADNQFNRWYSTGDSPVPIDKKIARPNSNLKSFGRGSNHLTLRGHMRHIRKSLDHGE